VSEAWSRLVNAAGAFGAAVALVYLIGAVSLSLRYEGFGLPSHQAAAVTPREVLLAAGLRTLVIWAALGLATVLLLSRVPDARSRRLTKPLAGWPGRAAILAVAVVLLLVLRVWWPLALFGAVLALLAADASGKPLSALIGVGALAAALVAAAYEADRLSYLIEWTCVRTAATESQAQRRICGTLVGQQDRGFYLGVPVGNDAAARSTNQYRLAFIPAGRVESANEEKRLARVIARHAQGRRERLVSRVVSIRVR
jgi:hypothetical protein